jgi:hypothetical protein
MIWIKPFFYFFLLRTAAEWKDDRSWRSRER